MTFNYDRLGKEQQIELYKLWRSGESKDVLDMLKKHKVIKCKCVGIKACTEWLVYLYENNIWDAGELE